MSHLMLRVAHDGPTGLDLSRRDVEKLNLRVVQFIWRMEDIEVSEIAQSSPHTHVSRPQVNLHTSFIQSLGN